MSAEVRGGTPSAQAMGQGEPSQAAMRRSMFLSQDGVVLCTTLRALEDLGILAPSLERDRSLADLYPGLTDAGFGALRVGVRSLVGAGWLSAEASLHPETTVLRWTDQGRLVGRHKGRYVALGRFLAGFTSAAEDAWRRPWDSEQTAEFLDLVALACDRWRLAAELPAELAALICAHLDGALIVPTMLWLHETGSLDEDRPKLTPHRAGEGMGRLLAALGWTHGPGGNWTASGRRARAYALNFGGVATYLPLLARLPDIYRGRLTVAPASEDGEAEWHVHRELNLRISAAAHRRYFHESDSIFLELFNRQPISAQPQFIADMGSGDGSWLIHLHGLIRDRTRRGEQLESDPLLMVGIDIDSVALEQARRNLGAAGVTALLIPGDVTDPDGLKAALAERGLAMQDGLHIRAFIDHERAYLGSDAPIQVPGWSSGAYLDASGHPLAGEAVERDLVEHLRRWAKDVRKHGMIVLEAHCVAPRVAARQPGLLHSVALDAHQAYSKQYPIDHAAFLRCCHEAGLQTVSQCERRYPARLPFVAVSLNRLLAPGAEPPLPAMNRGSPRRDTWRPGPETDLKDGRALHSILFTGGDIRYPASWGSAPTGFVVAGVLEVIERRLDRSREGDSIRVLDYGAGTGTATIELLKACRERGIEGRLDRGGVSLEVHLVDLPTSWFAQGYALLGDCAWTRFHSLRAAGGGFRPLLEVTGGELMDAVMANMVFHLIPPRALEHAGAELASVLTPGGQLLWSAPDLGPPGPSSLLLHDPNRALRRRWLELLDPSHSSHRLDDAAEHGHQTLSPLLMEAIRLAHERLDGNALRAAQDRANRRILPGPLAADVTKALAGYFTGDIEHRTYEMLGDEIVRGLLVPSNQAEYLPEISDRQLREQVIRELMCLEILPAMQASGAGTELGLNLHWTLGAFSRQLS